MFQLRFCCNAVAAVGSLLYLCRDCCNCSYDEKKSQIVHSRTLLVYYFLQSLALKDFAVLLSCLETMIVFSQALCFFSVAVFTLLTLLIT